jgi:hypothetical protein
MSIHREDPTKRGHCTSPPERPHPRDIPGALSVRPEGPPRSLSTRLCVTRCHTSASRALFALGGGSSARLKGKPNERDL